MFYRKHVKRLLDFVLSLFAIIILSPALLTIFLLVRLELGRPAIFKQKRPGQYEKIFTLYKFRTMTDERRENGELLPAEKRLTGFGKILRSTSLDELPELFNILKGDIALVGPRPLLIRYLPLYNDRQRRRHEVKPGLTGLAQVNGRNAISWEQKFELDIEYIRNITFFGDLKIIFKTIVKVLKRDGISSDGSATAEAFKGPRDAEDCFTVTAGTVTDNNEIKILKLLENKRMKSIWILNHYATEMYRDRDGRHFWFAKKLADRGYRPTIFCANTSHSKNESISTGREKYSIKYDGTIPFVFVKTMPATGNGIDRIRNMLLFYLNLFPVIRSYVKKYGKPDVILASSVHPLTMVAGIKIAGKLKVPCICEVRDLWPEAIFAFGKLKPKSLFGRALTAGEHWIYRKADALIFTKEGDTDYLKEKKWDVGQNGDINLAKCHYINNGVNLEVFEESIISNTMNDDDLDKARYFNVVYVGTIRPVNNVSNLLHCAKLLQEHKGIRFLIYGDGNQLEELKGRVRDEGLENVRLKGYVPRKYIPYILSKSSVNILNYSDKYNWSRGNSSNKLFEYMASGKPVISTVKMGYCIISKYRCGLSLDECTPLMLAEAILKVRNLPVGEYKKMCDNAKEGAKDFDFEVLTDKLKCVIGSVLTGDGNA